MQPVTAWIDVEGSIDDTDPTRSDMSWWMIGRMFTPNGGCAAVCISAKEDGSNPFGTAFSVVRSRSGAYYTEDKAGDDIANWTVTNNPGHDPAAGIFDFRMSVIFWVPPGETTLAVNPQFEIIQGGSDTTSCDFGNTASFRFGDMPEGVRWASESGVFLTGLDEPPVETPAPASLAALSMGLAAFAVAAKRRIRG